MTIDELKQREQALLDREKRLTALLAEGRERAYVKFPLVFALLVTFGLVATFYGFEHIIDSIDFFSDNPIILLGTGISILVVTGSVYRKLQ
jgi:hypothetical protein